MQGVNTPVSLLIVDDEQEACVNLKNMLEEYVSMSVDIVGMANNTRDAERMIERLKPDAILLDIEMPRENAFNFLDRISPVDFEVMFVTAYDDYAIKAFKLNAVDYILKPISIKELKEGISKLIERVRIKQMMGNVQNAYSEIASQITGKIKGNKIRLRDNSVVEVVDFKDIYFIEAQGSYFKVAFMKDNIQRDIVMSGSLTDYEELLPPELFFRIHKSYVINCMHVKRILKDGPCFVVIKPEVVLPVSRRRYPLLIEFLKNNDFNNE